jgi:hypothetical protein
MASDSTAAETRATATATPRDEGTKRELPRLRKLRASRKPSGA